MKQLATGVAKVLGVKVTRITNAYAQQVDATETEKRIIAAAGIPVNMFAGLAALLLGRLPRTDRHFAIHYFLWLFGYTSILSGANYMLGFSFLKIGDVNAVVRGLPNEAVWRTAITIVGVIVMCVAWYFAVKTFVRFVGGEDDRRRRAAMLTLVPYFMIGLISVGTAVLFAAGDVPMWLLLVSAGGATFGSNAFLLWMNLFVRKSGAAPTLAIPRHTGWIITGGVSFVLYCVLARGIDF